MSQGMGGTLRALTDEEQVAWAIYQALAPFLREEKKGYPPLLRERVRQIIDQLGPMPVGY